ncbi:MAG: hypothetical protein AB4040_03410 [Synechococcus sp.]
MKAQPSNAKFMRLYGRLRKQTQDYFWIAFTWFIALINDRLLPENRAIDAQAIADWCNEFLAAHDAGDRQYRGLPVDPEFVAALDSPGNLEDFTYRGIEVSLKGKARPAFLLGSGTAKPFVPGYQIQLRRWIVQSDLTDKDLVAVTPEIQANFRGRDI